MLPEATSIVLPSTKKKLPTMLTKHGMTNTKPFAMQKRLLIK
jgi:hypothetical protein